MNVYSTRKILKLFFVQDMYGSHYTDLLKWFGSNLFYYQGHRSIYEVSVVTVCSVTFALSPSTVTFCHFFQIKIFPCKKTINADNISKVLEQKKVNNDSLFNIS